MKNKKDSSNRKLLESFFIVKILIKFEIILLINTRRLDIDIEILKIKRKKLHKNFPHKWKEKEESNLEWV